MSINKFSDITKADVKLYFGTDPLDTSKDSRIDAMLPMITDRITRYCRNNFDASTIVVNEEPKIQPHSDTFFVKQRPIVSITEVRENDILLVEGQDYGVFKNEGRFVKYQEVNFNFTRPSGGVWDCKQGAVKVSYVGGEALPMDVVQVFYEMVGIFTGLRTRAYITNAGIEQVVSLNSVPKEFMDILDLHTKAREIN